MSVRSHRTAEATALALVTWCVAVAVSALVLLGCAATEQVAMAPTSLQTVEYYPFQVKGYENTYPKRRLVVLTPIDARNFKDIAVAHSPNEGHPAIGVIRGRSGDVEQRLYGPLLQPLVQASIARAAQEAGMVSSTSKMPLVQALSSRLADYVIMAKIARCWVDKHRGPQTSAVPTWLATAEVGLDISLYKSPFPVPFWQGESVAVYDDPPPPVAGGPPEDETEIYDNPGQVLSVALTRAVAGIFQRDDLHTLLVEDSASSPK